MRTRHITIIVAIAVATTACSTPVVTTDAQNAVAQVASGPNSSARPATETRSTGEAVTHADSSSPSGHTPVSSRVTNDGGEETSTKFNVLASPESAGARDVASFEDAAFVPYLTPGVTTGSFGKSRQVAGGGTATEPDALRVAQATEDQATPPAASAAGGNAGGQPSLAQMAQKANNPLSDVWLLITQNDTTTFEGDLVDGKRTLNSTKLQPVMPVPVFDNKWNLIFRPVVQVISSPLDKDVGDLFGVNQGQIAADNNLRGIAQDPYGRTTGLGDSVLLTLLGPNRDDGFVWGGGVTNILPTATEDVLGQGKWQAGPAAIAIRLGKDDGGLGIENWNIGALAQHWWSYAGDNDREKTNQTDVQYFLNWKMNKTQLIGMTPNFRINWKARSGEKVSFPVGLGTIGMFKIGRLPVRWGIEVQRYVVQPDDVASKWNFKVFVAPIILNPLK